VSEEEETSEKPNEVTDRSLRENTDEEIEQFLKDDELTGEATEIARRFREMMDSLECGD
jgi:uncharacterized protein YaaN involved in tellurite resistance